MRSFLNLALAALLCCTLPLAGAHAQRVLTLGPDGQPNTPGFHLTAHNYAVEATAGVDDRLAGKTPGAATLAIFSAVDDTAHVYTRNASAWFADLDLTCVSAATSNGWRVTAITRRHVVTAHHIFLPVGTVCYFVDRQNNTVARTITDVQEMGSTDLMVDTLDNDLPASITPAAVLPATLPVGLSLLKLPSFYTNQFREGHVADIVQEGGAIWINSSTVPQRAPWTVTPNPAIAGDSSSPYFLILGGRVVLLGCFFSAGGGAPNPGTNIAAIQAITGGGYPLTVAAMPTLSLTSVDASALVLTATDGTRWRLSVSTTGALSAAPLP